MSRSAKSVVIAKVLFPTARWTSNHSIFQYTSKLLSNTMPSTKKRKRPITRSWVDLCSNDVTLDGFTIKERVTVSHSLGYSISTISKYFTLENMTRKDMCVDCDSPELVSLLFWLFTIVILSLLACRCDIPDLACSLDDYQRSGSTVNTNKATTKGLEKTHG